MLVGHKKYIAHKIATTQKVLTTCQISHISLCHRPPGLFTGNHGAPTAHTHSGGNIIGVRLVGIRMKSHTVHPRTKGHIANHFILPGVIAPSTVEIVGGKGFGPVFFYTSCMCYGCHTFDAFKIMPAFPKFTHHHIGFHTIIKRMETTHSVWLNHVFFTMLVGQLLHGFGIVIHD